MKICIGDLRDIKIRIKPITLYTASIFRALLTIIGFYAMTPPFLLFLPTSALAETDEANLVWKEIEPGYSLGRYSLDPSTKVLKSEVVLVKFSPQLFAFELVTASQFDSSGLDVRRMAKQSKALASINAHFFDKKGDPLGLIIKNGVTKRKIHRGGKLLTGIFQIQNDSPSIIHREKFASEGVELALQSGPRLIVGSKKVRVSKPDVSSRRSGIAVTKSGEIILFATILRFPGASFSQIQEMLLNPALGVTDALNLDGGSSSQLFVEKSANNVYETFVTGGSPVPVGLVVVRKSLKNE